MKISYECEELIAELKQDIEEFGGDTTVVVWCMDMEDTTIYTNYDFETDDFEISDNELNKNEYFKKMKMKDLLDKLINQNSIL